MSSYVKCDDIKDIVPVPEPGKKSFGDFYLEAIDKFPSSFLVDGTSHEKLHFSDLAARIRYFSSNVLEYGYNKGDVICLMSKNCSNFVIALVGCSLSHVTVSPANPAYTGTELLYQLEVSDSKAIIIQNSLLPSLEAALSTAKSEGKNLQLGEIFVLDISSETPTSIVGVGVVPFSKLTEKPPGKWREPESVLDPKNDMWLLPFSSGTTGLPKGVSLTHYNMIANVWQLIQYKSLFDLSERSTMIGVLPLYHIYGLYIYSLCCPMKGANVVLLPEFQPVSFLSAIHKYRATHVYIVPPLALFLTKDPRVKQYDLTNIQDVLCAAAPLALATASELRDSLRDWGAKDAIVRQGWGMTELSPLGSVGRLDETDSEKLLASIGDPVALTELKIVDLNTNEVVDLGREGEICVRGPQVMKEYFKNEEATRITIDSDGWLHTGDIAKIHNSQILITDRLKELIKTKGFQVAPAELEGILLTHPAVQDCCVFGRPHDSLGEAPSACVVLKPGGGASRLPSEQELKAFVGQKVAPYKQLAGGVTFVDQVPKTASGKILRRVLRARFT